MEVIPEYFKILGLRPFLEAMKWDLSIFTLKPEARQKSSTTWEKKQTSEALAFTNKRQSSAKKKIKEGKTTLRHLNR